MRVWVYPLDSWGCGHYRMYWPACAVAELDLPDVRPVPVTPDRRRVAIHFDPSGRVARDEFPAEEGDVVLFQRPTGSWMPGLVDALQARGVAVVVDMDDDLSALHPSNAAFVNMHPRSTSPHSWHTAAETCRRAALVTVTTPALADRYGAHGRVRVLPNVVPAEYLDVDHVDSADIGWAGVVHTHPDDLQQVGGAVARLVTRGATFRTVGDPTGVGRALGLPRDPPSTGNVAIYQYPATVAELGIGIAPLALTRFNDAKSRLKPLEYAALGVPWVGSPAADYRAFHAEGTGLLAERPRDWERTLRRLTADRSLRVEMSEAGRDVARRHTFEATAWRWAEAWADAVAELDRLRPASPASPPGRSGGREAVTRPRLTLP